MKKSILFAALTLAVCSAFATGNGNAPKPNKHDNGNHYGNDNPTSTPTGSPTATSAGGTAYGGLGGNGYGVGVGVGVGTAESNATGGAGGLGGVGMGGSATGGSSQAVGGAGGSGGAAGNGGAGGVSNANGGTVNGTGTVAVNAVGSTYEAAASTAYAPDGKAPRTSCRLFVGLGGSDKSGALSGGIPIGNDQTCLSGAAIEAMDKANKVYPGSFLIGDYLKAICLIEGMDKTEGCKVVQP